MTVLQTAISVEGQDGKIFMCDTIIHKGEPWLVLSWLQGQVGEPKRPERIVRVAAFEHQEMGPDWPSRWLINYPIPKCLFDGPIPESLASDVIDLPEVSVLIGRA